MDQDFLFILKSFFFFNQYILFANLIKDKDVKTMSEEFKTLVDSSFNKAIAPIWIYTEDYIYGMMPADENGERWTEISYTFEMDDPLRTSEKSADLAYQFLFEELEKGLSFYVEDFNVNKLKNFANSLEGKSGSEKIITLIKELNTNTDEYASDLPIIRSRENADTLKQKV